MKVNVYARLQVLRTNSSAARVRKNGQTDKQTHMTENIISSANAIGNEMYVAFTPLMSVGLLTCEHYLQNCGGQKIKFVAYRKMVGDNSCRLFVRIEWIACGVCFTNRKDARLPTGIPRNSFDSHLEIQYYF